MKKFSVLLLYPDYIATNYGHETFYVCVEADDVDQAVLKAREDAVRSNSDGGEDTEELMLYKEDFHVLLALEGYHPALEYGEKD